MRIFFDSEFTGLQQDTTLISIAFVAENGREFYAEFTDYNKSLVNDWIQKNVIDNLYLPKTYINTCINIEEKHFRAKGSTRLIVNCLTEWLNSFDKQLEMWSDTLAYDWVLFCQLWGNALDVPKCVYYIPFDLATLFKLKNMDPDINREAFAEMAGDGQKHNALWDAKIIKACYQRLTSNES